MYWSGIYYNAKVASIKARHLKLSLSGLEVEGSGASNLFEDLGFGSRGVKIYTLDWDDGDPKDKEKTREQLRPKNCGPVLSAPGFPSDSWPLRGVWRLQRAFQAPRAQTSALKRMASYDT